MREHTGSTHTAARPRAGPPAPQAKSRELCAALSLSRLWQCQGRRAAARQLLAEVYGWFTEGFDTANVQEANGPLEHCHHWLDTLPLPGLCTPPACASAASA
jgi:predicted ATPase